MVNFVLQLPQTVLFPSFLARNLIMFATACIFAESIANQKTQIMRKRYTWTIIGLLLSTHWLIAQSVNIEGYVFEAGNRGYLNAAKVTLIDTISQSIAAETVTNSNGVFTAQVPVGRNFRLEITKDLFARVVRTISTVGKGPGQKIFTRVEMTRQPGYIFDVTLAEKSSDQAAPTKAITKARIEVYNNTTREQVLTLEEHPKPTFKTHFKEGNHYTVLIRKQGFFSKWLEAYVNVEGCILCFEGVGSVRPSDVLTEGHAMGTLLANVELQAADVGKGIQLDRIYYDYDAADIRGDAKPELDKLINVLQTNPSMIVELGSHTDSRGRGAYNLALSEKRAQSAVDYLLTNSTIEPYRIQAKGYGETQLLNDCADGVKCRDSKHQENRRTELKIVGFLTEDPYAELSLAQIIEEERFAAQLANLEEGEVIEVVEGEALPESLQRALEKQRRDREQWRRAAAGQGQTMGGQPRQYELEGPARSTRQPSATPRPNTRPTNPPAANEALTLTELLAQEADPTPTGYDDGTTRRINSPNNRGTTPRPATRTSPNKRNTTTTGTEPNSRIISGLPEVGPTTSGRHATKLPADYTGYRVEFFVAPYELPGSHEIFAKHGNLSVEQRKDGAYAYLMGDFTDWRDANQFLTSIISQRYPEARVIRYKKGRRLVN